MIPLVTLTSRDLDRVSGARCAETDPALFWPEHANELRGPEKAIALCKECPVRTACLDQALRFDEPHGIWGGLTPEERQLLKRGAA